MDQTQLFSPELLSLARDAEDALRDTFARLDALSFENTARVLDAFRRHGVSDSHFAGTSGYGYDDRGRDTLDLIYADVFGAERAFVRHSIACGTHALSIALYGLLRPGDVMLSVTGRPYDTLAEVIGIAEGGEDMGSLADFGVRYREVAMKDGKVDLASVAAALGEEGARVKIVYLQRSKGYADRPTLTVSEIGEVARFVHESCGAYVVVDNCYGEFCENREPTAVGADLIVGSLIKNPGGGIAEGGAYLAGTARAIEKCGARFTCPGEGLEVGASHGQNKSLYRGFFMAPHTVAAALKTAHFAAYVFDRLGFDVSPGYLEPRSDIIQMIRLGTADGLIRFCRGIQSGSPVDAFVAPEPSDMPGYADQVIMAAGTFVQGASIELSADGPLRAPYTAFLQGGLTFESGKYGILKAAAYVTAQ